MVADADDGDDAGLVNYWQRDLEIVMLTSFSKWWLPWQS